MLPHSWNAYGLHKWPPTSPFQVVGDLFECWGTWSEAEETDLKLFDFEFAAYSAYSNPAHGSDKRVLGLSEVASTFLLFYGNALMACPWLFVTKLFVVLSWEQCNLLMCGHRFIFFSAKC